jgi:hypothetical protein
MSVNDEGLTSAANEFDCLEVSYTTQPRRRAGACSRRARGFNPVSANLVQAGAGDGLGGGGP